MVICLVRSSVIFLIIGLVVAGVSQKGSTHTEKETENQNTGKTTQHTQQQIDLPIHSL